MQPVRWGVLGALLLGTCSAACITGKAASPPGQQEIGHLLDDLKAHDAVTRQDAAVRLAPFAAEPRVVSALRSALADADPSVRLAAAESLVGVPGEHKGALAVVIAGLEDPSVQEVAARIAARFGKEAADTVPGLVRTLRSPDWHTRLTAAGALGAIGPAARTALPVLMNLAQLDDNESVRRQSRLASYLVDTENGVQPLIKMVRDEGSLAAVDGLGNMGSAATAAVVTLAEALKRPPDDPIRIRAAIALGRIGSLDAVPALQEALRGGDSELRLVAREALDRIQARR